MTRRVLLLVSTLDGGGPGSVMATLARGLLEFDASPILVATHGPTDSRLIRETRRSGVPIANLEMRWMADPIGVRRFASLLRRSRPDIVHTRTIRADLLGRVAALSGISVINNVVNLYPDDCLVRLGPVVGRGVMGLAIASARAARMIVANSSAVADNARAAFHLPHERVRVVLDGIPFDRWVNASPADLATHSIAETDTVCLTVARLHPQKGLEDLIDAAAEVVRRRKEVRFVVAGEGPSRSDLEARLRARGLDGKVILLGHREDVPNLLARADLFVLPSRFEGLPTAIIEAMAAGRPVVATSVAGTPEIVREGETGWLVPPGQPSALANSILRALDSDLEATGESARQHARRQLSANTMSRSFADLYDEIAREVPDVNEQRSVRRTA